MPPLTVQLQREEPLCLELKRPEAARVPLILLFAPDTCQNKTHSFIHQITFGHFQDASPCTMLWTYKVIPVCPQVAHLPERGEPCKLAITKIVWETQNAVGAHEGSREQ